MLRPTFFALALTALISPAVAKPIDAYPPDPAGVVIQDRLYEQLEVGADTYSMYAVMYAAGEHGSKVEIYQGTDMPTGMDWKKLYTWDVPRGPEKIDVLSVNVVEGTIQFASTSWFKYVEARALPVLDYDPKTGKFAASLAD